MTQEKKEIICNFVKESIKNKQFNDELVFSLPIKTIERVQRALHFDISQYILVISSHSVRHIQKGHSSEVKLICELLELIQQFYEVKKSITKDYKTGKTLVSLEFYNKLDNKILKTVKLKIYKSKRLELKTLFFTER